MGKLYQLFSRGFVFNVVELDKKLHKKNLKLQKTQKKTQKNTKKPQNPFPKLKFEVKCFFLGLDTRKMNPLVPCTNCFSGKWAVDPPVSTMY